MSTDQKQGLVKAQGLTRTELAEIALLADLCNRQEGLDLKLNRSILEKREQDQTNDFLYYENGVLIGFLALFSFSPAEVEISGMVHPEYRRRGVFTELYAEARARCQRCGFSKILLIVEAISSAGQAFAQALGAGYDHSEYAMVLDEARAPVLLEEHLHFRSATPADLPLLTSITARVFALPASEGLWYSAARLAQADYEVYVGELAGNVIGKIDVALSTQGGLLYGFGVLPEYQGRGYGRQLLARTIQELLARGKREITLEVSVTNTNALSLYHSCGFKETRSYEYYQFFL
jgi:ribosomal protein S18 acetylase RimI-like enzyme